MTTVVATEAATVSISILLFVDAIRWCKMLSVDILNFGYYTKSVIDSISQNFYQH